jgi:hypothetical protein
VSLLLLFSAPPITPPEPVVSGGGGALRRRALNRVVDPTLANDEDTAIALALALLL